MRTSISVKTLFDCTATGTRSHYKPGTGRTHDALGHDITQPDAWNRSRNQQRNWETLLQCLSLRCQPLNIIEPAVLVNSEGELSWVFGFETDQDSIFEYNGDPLGALKQDCHGVPMIVGLDETWKEGFLMPYLLPWGSSQNLFLEINS